MLIDAPGVVQVVAPGGESLHHAHVLQEPIAGLVVGFAGALATIVVSPIAEKYANWFLVALADEIGVGVASADIDEAANVAQNFAEFVRPLPRDGESSDRSGARPADAALIGVFGDVVLLVKRRHKFADDY